MNLLTKHRTKILGGTQVAFGAAVTYLPQLQSAMRPVHYGLVMMGIGVSTAVMGFINSTIASEQK